VKTGSRGGLGELGSRDVGKSGVRRFGNGGAGRLLTRVQFANMWNMAQIEIVIATSSVTVLALFRYCFVVDEIV
jgi:hypothetical protein